ncbi:hypothetical protein Tco_0933674, partial [Tanacetum coccineum]
GEVRGGGVILGVAMSFPEENPGGAKGDIYGDSRGVESGAV